MTTMDYGYSTCNCGRFFLCHGEPRPDEWGDVHAESMCTKHAVDANPTPGMIGKLTPTGVRLVAIDGGKST